VGEVQVLADESTQVGRVDWFTPLVKVFHQQLDKATKKFRQDMTQLINLHLLEFDNTDDEEVKAFRRKMLDVSQVRRPWSAATARGCCRFGARLSQQCRRVGPVCAIPGRHNAPCRPRLGLHRCRSCCPFFKARRSCCWCCPRACDHALVSCTCAGVQKAIIKRAAGGDKAIELYSYPPDIGKLLGFTL